MANDTNHSWAARVPGKSVLQHNRQWAWQRTELPWVYGDTVMIQTDRATRVYRDTGVVEMDWVMGSLYLGHSGVGSLHRIFYLISWHLIIQRIIPSVFCIFWSYSLFWRLHVDPRNGTDRHNQVVSYLLTIFLQSLRRNSSFSTLFWNARRGAAECWWWALCLLAPPFHHKWSPKTDSRLES